MISNSERCGSQMTDQSRACEDLHFVGIAERQALQKEGRVKGMECVCLAHTFSAAHGRMNTHKSLTTEDSDAVCTSVHSAVTV